ncbi:MarR family transcriptional regulator [Vagococcus sp. BWB3-3]|uniref:MarR family transcriptional regulator n=1 Tax=Vagococcus allomyrinae TaxID=2794353 RepID=A0A940PI30_9ENTE|nr:MarR family transcriptional regulator [Vagococcus allomyrinae]MBP1043986.1 MarR family transcriptional regulator [Vagococcus allomyrinae]
MEKISLSNVVWLRMIRFIHLSNQLSNEHLKEFGLTVAQFDTLIQIKVYQPLTQGALAEKTTVTQGGISRMLSRLEKDGYIHRKTEWKTKTISLTQAGEAILSQAQPSQEAFQERFFTEALTVDELQEFSRMMSKIHRKALEH